MKDPIQDSPLIPSPAVSTFVEATDQLIREHLAKLTKEEALDAIDLLRERLIVMMQQ